MFFLTFATGNAAFNDGTGGLNETARILRDVADRLDNGLEAGRAVDTNGNKVGAFALAEADDASEDESMRIGGGCANVYLAKLLGQALDRAKAGEPLNALDIAALDEAQTRIDENASENDDAEDYYGPDGPPVDILADDA